MDWKPEHFAYAEGLDGQTVTTMAKLARELGVVIPVNFFERANNAYYNTVAMVDADGATLGIYRKTHIPVGPPGCYEKVYTSPGDTGFQAWRTAFGTVGVGICWDQWFPELARIMCLKVGYERGDLGESIFWGRASRVRTARSSPRRPRAT